jgi:hypothetical protein
MTSTADLYRFAKIPRTAQTSRENTACALIIYTGQFLLSIDVDRADVQLACLRHHRLRCRADQLRMAITHASRPSLGVFSFQLAWVMRTAPEPAAV